MSEIKYVYDWEPWLERFEKMTELERLDTVLQVLTQKEVDKESKAAQAIYETMFVGLHKYVDKLESQQGDF